jgi:hypothetical protein
LTYLTFCAKIIKVIIPWLFHYLFDANKPISGGYREKNSGLASVDRNVRYVACL